MTPNHTSDPDSLSDQRSRKSGLSQGALLGSINGLIEESLSIVKRITAPHNRALALATYAPHFPESERLLLMRDAVDTARRIFSELVDNWDNENSRNRHYIDAIAKLAPHLKDSLLGDALYDSAQIADNSCYTEAIIALAPPLSDTARRTTFKTALKRIFQFDRLMPERIIDIAPHLPTEFLAEALNAAKRISDTTDRGRAISALAPHLPESLVASVFEIAENLSNYSPTDSFDLELNNRPQNDEHPKIRDALEALRALKKAEERESADVARAQLLTALAPRLPENDRLEVLSKAHDCALAVSDNEKRAELLKNLVALMPKDQCIATWCQALAAAIHIESDHIGCVASQLVHLIPTLSVAPTSDLFDAVRTISDPMIRSHALFNISLLLPEHEQTEVRDEAYNEASKIPDATSHAIVLVVYAKNLAGIQRIYRMREAVSLARQINDAFFLCHITAGFSHYLPIKERRALQHETLHAVRGISNNIDRATNIIKLAPCLPESERLACMKEVLIIAKSLKDRENNEDDCTKILVNLFEILVERDKIPIYIDDELIDSYEDDDMPPIIKDRGEGLEDQFKQLLTNWRAILGGDCFDKIIASFSSTDNRTVEAGLETRSASEALTRRKRTNDGDDTSTRHISAPGRRKPSIPLLPNGISWPSEKYETSPERGKRNGIISFLRRVWKEPLGAGLVSRPVLAYFDETAERAVRTYLNNNGNPRPLPPDLKIPTLEEANDLLIASGTVTLENAGKVSQAARRRALNNHRI